ncbi:AzlD domain-containing protein [Ruminococcaceae bacterium OttesenSCG-928-A16]|nr:AzlD domain-containing protein [Ruminococcaceae bacterium OttesenSCG-928-A16]
MTPLEAVIMVALFTLATVITRVAAFALFPASRPTPHVVVYLGRVLPFAITGMLVVYCLKNVSLFAAPFGLPEGIAIAVVVVLYLGVKNSLLAIAAGTVVYMLLVQLVFI